MLGLALKVAGRIAGLMADLLFGPEDEHANYVSRTR